MPQDTPTPDVIVQDNPAPVEAPTTLVGAGIPETTSEPQEQSTLVQTHSDQPIESVPEWVNQTIPEKYRMDPNFSKYKDLNSFIEGHLSLSKKIGEKFEAPTSNDPEAWNDWYKKTGRPDEPGDYKYEAPENMNLTPEQIDITKQAFHSLGLSQKQFEGIMGMYSASLNEQSEANAVEAAQMETEHQMKAVGELQREWGNEFEINLKIANQTLEKFGLADRILELGLGNDVAAVKLGYDLAQKTGETKLNTFESHPTSFAESVKSLKESNAFKNRLHPEHKRVMKQIEDLYKRQHGV